MYLSGGAIHSCVIHAVFFISMLSAALSVSSNLYETGHGELSDILHSYETLHRQHLRHHVGKRSVGSENGDERKVSFSTLGREFHLSLKKSRDVLVPGFQVLSVDKHDNAKPVDMDSIDMYTGTLEGEDNSLVEAYFEEDEGEENLVATIHTKQDVFVVEPSWRHLSKSDNYTMISYRGSDLKMKDTLGPSYCGFVRPDEDEASYDHVDKDMEEEILSHHGHNANEDPAARYRRQSQQVPRQNTCPLLLVADYRFYDNMGQKSLKKTVAYLISLIHRVNQIYRGTTWGNGYTGMGFGIKEIHVHEEWTVLAGGAEHYNMQVASWETKRLLEVFSRDGRHRDFCLSHLFTSRHFLDGSLGLSYVASPILYNPGGLCSPAYYKEGYQLYLNTGWSSSLNRYNRRLLTQEADLVTTHEFGHNWGSEHDPDTDECSPNAFGGGKYIMYTYSVSGHDTNNDVFSPCSRRSIGAVLSTKSHKCFTEPITAYCGNALVEQGEECDPGPQSSGRNGDDCCDSSCRLKTGNQCSDMNDACCMNCRLASSGTVCHEAQEGTCEDTSKCTGLEKTCPVPPNKRNGSECIGRGHCEEGICISYCEKQGMLSCACDQVPTSCKWCCRAREDDATRPNKSCMPTPDNFNLPDGMPCVQGYCVSGVCEKQVQDLVQRFWDIIEQLEPSRIVAFMKANIVGTVIILSLLLWIPASCVVCHLDRKAKRQDESEREWLSASNHTLVHPMDSSLVRRTNRVQPRRREFTSATREPMVRAGQPQVYPPSNYKPMMPNQPTTYI